MDWHRLVLACVVLVGGCHAILPLHQHHSDDVGPPADVSLPADSRDAPTNSVPGDLVGAQDASGTEGSLPSGVVKESTSSAACASATCSASYTPLSGPRPDRLLLVGVAVFEEQQGTVVQVVCSTCPGKPPLLPVFQGPSYPMRIEVWELAAPPAQQGTSYNVEVTVTPPAKVEALGIVTSTWVNVDTNAKNPTHWSSTADKPSFSYPHKAVSGVVVDFVGWKKVKDASPNAPQLLTAKSSTTAGPVDILVAGSHRQVATAGTILMEWTATSGAGPHVVTPVNLTPVP